MELNLIRCLVLVKFKKELDLGGKLCNLEFKRTGIDGASSLFFFSTHPTFWINPNKKKPTSAILVWPEQIERESERRDGRRLDTTGRDRREEREGVRRVELPSPAHQNHRERPLQTAGNGSPVSSYLPCVAASLFPFLFPASDQWAAKDGTGGSHGS